MPNIRWLLGLITRVQRWLYVQTDGRIGASFFGMQMLLLTTVGRRSGIRRTVPLLYVTDAERFIVVGSNAGDDRAPAWWLNLQRHPHARIQVGADHYAVKAREAEAEETQRMWGLLTDSYHYYEDYRRRTAREIPIVVLERE